MRGFNSAVRTYYFGPFNIKIKDLTVIRHVVFNNPIMAQGEKYIFLKELKKDIKKNGLKNPIEVQWLLLKGRIGKLTVAKGNTRVKAFQELGKKKIPCYLRIFVYKDRGELEDLQSIMFDMMKKFLPFIRQANREDYAPPNLSYIPTKVHWQKEQNGEWKWRH